jgi:hypothetical protein
MSTVSSRSVRQGKQSVKQQPLPPGPPEVSKEEERLALATSSQQQATTPPDDDDSSSSEEDEPMAEQSTAPATANPNITVSDDRNRAKINPPEVFKGERGKLKTFIT